MEVQIPGNVQTLWDLDQLIGEVGYDECTIFITLKGRAPDDVINRQGRGVRTALKEANAEPSDILKFEIFQ
jgi:hypothetical protein